MGKDVRFQDEARQALKRGVDLIANAVKATLGPKGRNVVYTFHYGSPIATKDGVTVARQVEAVDEMEQAGVLLIRQVAQKTADDAGDGTTTASVLAQAIYTEGLKSLNTGANPILIKRGIDKAVEEVLKYIDDKKQEIKGEEGQNTLYHQQDHTGDGPPRSRLQHKAHGAVKTQYVPYLFTKVFVLITSFPGYGFSRHL